MTNDRDPRIDRTKEILSKVSDDFLIDMATTCSNRGMALASEMQLRARYPSRKVVRRRKPAAAEITHKAEATNA